MKNNGLTKYIIIGIIVIIVLILLLRGCSGKAKIELLGQKQMTIYQNDRFKDPGYQITDTSDTSEYYINIEGYVNINKAGIYDLKYLLYNKNGSLVDSDTRKVIVLEDSASNIKIYPNGDEEEYYFVGDYIDKGIEAYHKGVNITNSVTVDSDINPNVVGQYEVKYQVKINNSVKEYIRIVNIVDFNIKESIDYRNLLINLLIQCKDYYYTLLPDGVKEYSNDVIYQFSNIGLYEFDVYLNSGSHKKYTVNINSVDKTGPSGTCSLTYESNTTTIDMNAYDDSGISKYVYNGLEFYNNSTVINSIITNATVRAYDKNNNYTDIKCKAEYGLDFRKIDISAKGRIQNKSGWIKCEYSFDNENNKLEALMQAYGYKTRGAVAAAAVFLAEYKYDIPYFWGGKYVHKGFNPDWGCRHKHTVDKPCTNKLSSDYSVCEWGLDCTGLTSWAFAQAGFDYELIRQSDQSGGRWGGSNGKFIAKNHRYKFSSQNMQYANQIKPGDLVANPGKHVGLVIGVSTNTIQILEMKGPIFVSTIDKRTGAGLNGQGDFGYFVLMEEFYKIYGNS